MKRLGFALAVAVLALSVLSVAPSARAATNGIHPGDQTYTNGAQCTANFVFSDGTSTYLGQAAHCSSTGSNTDTNGCTTQSAPIGTPVTILGANHPGTLAYNSWITMQQAGEKDPNACAYNDLALIRIDPADASLVSPNIPHWGGPTGINTTGTTSGDFVYSYGNSIIRLGITALSPKLGISQGDDGAGWTHVVTTVTPGIPGDSGSAFLDKNGNALGDLSTLSVGVPGGVQNNVSDLNHELAYMHAHGGPAANLVFGNAFNGSQVPLDTNHPVDDPVGGLRNFFGI
ncbi:MAG: serine protease [Acidimicrobiia bacterium]|nr:serine protease [Acidimicrobiia bacterium]